MIIYVNKYLLQTINFSAYVYMKASLFSKNEKTQTTDLGKKEKRKTTIYKNIDFY